MNSSQSRIIASSRRFLFYLVLGQIAFACHAFAQAEREEANLRDHPFEASLSTGTAVRVHLHDGDFRIVGSDSSKISVQADGANLAEARNIRIQLTHAGDAVDLRLSHVPKKELQVTITIPKTTNLYARMRGGDLSVEGIAGDKDLQLTGGDLTVQVGDPADYAHVDLSVRFGDVSGQQFGEPKGWIGNSLTRDGAGKYQLHAHVFAGDLVLKD
jgi:hypothetical protein